MRNSIDLIKNFIITNHLPHKVSNTEDLFALLSFVDKYGNSILSLSSSIEDGALFNLLVREASSCGILDIVINACMPGDNGLPILYYSILSVKTLSTVRLLENGAKVNGKYGKDKSSAIHLAAFVGNQEILETILKYTPDINATDANLYTALHIAAESISRFGFQHAMKIINILLEAGASHHLINQDSDTYKDIIDMSDNVSDDESGVVESYDSAELPLPDTALIG